jgi:hypothetical protein
MPPQKKDKNKKQSGKRHTKSGSGKPKPPKSGKRHT